MKTKNYFHAKKSIIYNSLWMNWDFILIDDSAQDTNLIHHLGKYWTIISSYFKDCIKYFSEPQFKTNLKLIASWHAIKHVLARSEATQP